jgi:hypothetical protein
MRNEYRILVTISGGKRPLGRLKNRWEDNIKGIGCEDMDWINLAQDRV